MVQKMLQTKSNVKLVKTKTTMKQRATVTVAPLDFLIN